MKKMLKKVTTKKGRVMYYRDGRLISEKDLTDEERQENSSTPQEPKPIEKAEIIPEEPKEEQPKHKVHQVAGIEIMPEDDDYEQKSIRPQVIQTKKEQPVTQPIEQTGQVIPELPKGCIFCGAPRESKKSIWRVDRRIEVDVCGGCYQGKTTGELAQRLNQLGR